MNISEIIQQLEKFANPKLQESYDNSKLLVGNENAKVDKVLLCLDSTEAVIDEAIENNCQLVIAHHPLIFSGLKSLTGKNYIEKTIIKAIKNDIAIYAIHTNLDNIQAGVNHKIAEKIGLQNATILAPKKGMLIKLVFFCPTANTKEVKAAIFEAGAGKIGEYDCCSFNLEGEGTFRAGENAKPYMGEKGELHEEKEMRVEVILPNYLESKVVKALVAAHPYEEVAYDLYSLKNSWKGVGSGMIGILEEEMEVEAFLDQLKIKFNTKCIRYTKLVNKKIKTVAFCGGSGSFLLESAISKKADIFITADYKYHQFFDANDKIIIADIGHFESEQFTPELIQDYLKEKIPNFATYLSKINTNPINYR